MLTFFLVPDAQTPFDALEIIARTTFLHTCMNFHERFKNLSFPLKFNLLSGSAVIRAPLLIL